MAAPTPTARVTPDGIELKDGYQTLITIAVDSNINFWEKTVKPPGFDGGDKIDITTMHNTLYRTFIPRALLTLTEVTTTALYDPILYDEAIAACNVATTITVRFTDLSTIAFFGYLRLFDPQDVEEGSPPECQITIEPTNYDPANNVEEAPVMTLVAGT